MKIEKLYVTPTMAAKLLEFNINNRPLRDRVVRYYANQMRMGLWREDTGDPIKLTKSQKLADGQHRLYAQVMANISITYLVIRELDDDVFPVLDTGLKRNGNDVFKIANISYSNILPSIIIRYINYKNKKAHSNQNTVPYSNGEILEFYNQKPEFWDNVASNTKRWYDDFARLISPATIGGTFAYLSDIDRDAAFDFFEQLCSGINTGYNINLLRKKIMADRVSLKRLPNVVILALIVHTWNLCRKGKKVKIIRYDPNTMEFPIAI
jgi:hypothetical protein